MAQKNINWLFILLIPALLWSCKKDEPPPVTPPVLDGGVYILNEGNYQWGNGRLDYLRFADNVYSTDLFGTVNEYPLGDVVQSMIAFNGRGYIVVNNSAKVEVVDIASCSSVGTISGLVSPRYLLPVSASKAYVSDLYSKCLHIIDLSTLSIIGNIHLNGSTEEMLMIGEIVFVTNTRTSYIYLINTSTDALIDSIAVGYASNSLVQDKNGFLWVMCAGNPTESVNASLHRIDPVLHQVTHSFDLGNALDIWDKLSINGSADRLYFMDNGIWAMDITASSLPAAPLIAEGSSQFHGLGIDPSSGIIYVSDAMDYVQAGRIFRYQSDGSVIDTLSAGIIPSEFYFY